MDKKDNRFSWKKKDEKDYGTKAAPDKKVDLKGEDDFMQFSSAMPGVNEEKKTAPEVQSYGEMAGKSAAPSFVPQKEASYISKDMVINGSVTAAGNIVIDGEVNGDVTTENDITVCGSIEGNIVANAAKFSGARIKGDVSSKGSISFVQGSSIEGNVSGNNAEINGSVQGNITVEQTAVIMGNASVNGDITAGLISVLEGAVIKGNVHVTKTEAPAAAAPKAEVHAVAAAAPADSADAAPKAFI